jgi:hypothetical protein
LPASHSMVTSGAWEAGETAGEDEGERHVGYYCDAHGYAPRASLLKRECPNLARLVRHALNRQLI